MICSRRRAAALFPSRGVMTRNTFRTSGCSHNSFSRKTFARNPVAPVRTNVRLRRNPRIEEEFSVSLVHPVASSRTGEGGKDAVAAQEVNEQGSSPSLLSPAVEDRPAKPFRVHGLNNGTRDGPTPRRALRTRGHERRGQGICKADILR